MARRITLGVALYAASGAVLLSASRIPCCPGRFAIWVIASIVLCATAIIGPPILLAAGSPAIPWIVGLLVLIAVCVRLSIAFWRRYPDTEEFMLFALPALLLWTGPGLLMMLVLLAD